MGAIRDLSEQLLSGAASVHEHNPMAPMLALEEVAPRAAFVSSFANVLAVDTDDGLVLVDTGSFFMAAATKAVVKTFSARRLHTALFTHGHVDHVFGVPLWEAEGGPVHVIAHEAVPRRFARYKLKQGYNSCINTRQFQIKAEFPAEFWQPDQTFAGNLGIEVGGGVSRSAASASRSTTPSARRTTTPGPGSPPRRSSPPGTSSSGPPPTPATRRRYSATRASGRPPSAP